MNFVWGILSNVKNLWLSNKKKTQRSTNLCVPYDILLEKLARLIDSICADKIKSLKIKILVYKELRSKPPLCFFFVSYLLGGCFLAFKGKNGGSYEGGGGVTGSSADIFLKN